MKIASVVFPMEMSKELGDKRYSYLTDIEDLDWEDTLVVETRYGMRVAVFMNYLEENSAAAKKASAWIVQKVDSSQVELSKVKHKKLQDVKNKLRVRKENLEEINLFKLMAKEDEEMRNLLSEYDAIMKGGI